MNANSKAIVGWSVLVTGVLPWFCDLRVQAADEAESSPAEETRKGEIEGVLTALESLVDALDKNLEAQKKAWPDHERLLGQEIAPPHEVRQLQTEYARLWRKRKRLEGELSRASGEVVAPVVSGLARAENEDVARLLAKVLATLVDRGRTPGEGAAATLRQVARRFTPCPPEIADALAGLGDRHARLFLLELGRRDGSLVVLRAAARHGEPAVLERLVKWAQSGEKDASLALRVLRQLEAPPRPVDGLSELVQSWIESAKTVELKSQLISYLGLLKDERARGFLTRLYESETAIPVRHATLNAIGRLGAIGAGFLVEELRDRTNELAVRRASIHALGGTDYAPATEALIHAMQDPRLRSDAVRALRRLSGKDFGMHPSAWLRWWRSQQQTAAARSSAPAAAAR